MKATLRRWAPEWFVRLARSIWNAQAQRAEYRYDRRRFARHSGPEDWGATAKLSGRNLEAQLTKDYHRVEKGLALREPKKPFGANVLDRLDMLLPVADEAEYRSHATSAREALVTWNSGGPIAEEVSPLATAADRGIADADQFFSSRHSVRDYSDREVGDDILDRAVRLAINAPSVCNRQSWFVRFYRDPEDVRHALSFQNGNAGIAHVPALALVTVDARLFTGSSERNQGFIEGGLFAMTLSWALHALGLDSLMLNLSISSQRMKRLRSGLGVADHEIVIMMMAIGYGREGHRIARSPRRPVSEVVLDGIQSEGSGVGS